MITTIQNFLLKFGLSNPPFASLNSGVPTVTQIQEILNFGNVNFVQMKEGTYTPNNDYEWLWESIPANESPTFIFLQTPTSVNISITTTDGQLLVRSAPANKLFMLCLPSNVIVSNIYLEGRPGQSSFPMAQGVPAEYFCLMAQATF
jgi:hypothetical protein